MQLTGEQRIAAAPQRVWEALNDPAVLRQCIPGCQSLDKEGDDRFAAVAEVRIGPIGARFKGAVTLSDIDAPQGYTITGQGNGGVAGNAKGSAKVRLREDSGATVLSYDVEAEVGGRMAQLGGPIIDATAKNLAGKFFEKFGAVVSGEAAGAPVGTASPVAAAPAAAMPAAAALPGVAASAPAGGAVLWGWVAALVMAVLAGFFLGFNAASGAMMAIVLILLIVVAAAAYQAGQRGGGR